MKIINYCLRLKIICDKYKIRKSIHTEYERVIYIVIKDTSKYKFFFT